jgi:hypothetical protein
MATTSVFLLRYPLASGTVNVSGDLQNLATDVDAALAMVGNREVFTSVGGCSLASSSGSYVDVTGASKAFTKIASAAVSDVVVRVGLGGFATITGTVFKVGVNINGVDTDVMSMLFNTANQHQGFPAGVSPRITGLAAGPYTVKLRALRVSGTGVITIDSNDTVSLDIEEVAV